MTQAYNLSQLANKVNTSGQIDVTTALNGTVPVISGGTGQTSFTDGQLLIGNSTGNTLTKATLTAGAGISVTNSGGSITIATTGGGQLAYALYSSGSGTWTCPSGVTKVKVTCIAGGGGSSDSGGTLEMGGYGGAAIGIYTVTPGTGYAYSVGAGGAYGAVAGGNGGSSSVTGLCSATGGTGAPSATNGTGSNGIFFNDAVSVSYVVQTIGNNLRMGSIYMFGGSVNTSASTSAVAWSSGSKLMPGVPGGASGQANGGVGGVILIEYIG